MDLKDKYRLVVATPSGVVRAWVPDNDDEHLKNIVDLVYDHFGEKRIRAFWLAGHSQGGQAANRLINEGAFRERLTGWVSLSGGRLGSKRSEVRAPMPSAPGVPPPGARSARPSRLVADASLLPDYPFSHIYTSGVHELPETGLPASSPWAEELQCGERARGLDVVEEKAGYVYDTREQDSPNAVWGFAARPGKAEVFVYPNCKKGRIVADIIRLDKGHTEGLEPNVTEEIVKLMPAASR